MPKHCAFCDSRIHNTNDCSSPTLQSLKQIYGNMIEESQGKPWNLIQEPNIHNCDRYKNFTRKSIIGLASIYKLPRKWGVPAFEYAITQIVYNRKHDPLFTRTQQFFHPLSDQEKTWIETLVPKIMFARKHIHVYPTTLISRFIQLHFPFHDENLTIERLQHIKLLFDGHLEYTSDFTNLQTILSHIYNHGLALLSKNQCKSFQTCILIEKAISQLILRNPLNITVNTHLLQAFQDEMRMIIPLYTLLFPSFKLPIHVLQIDTLTNTHTCECPICYETHCHSLSVLTNCSHSFCVGCMDKYLTSIGTTNISNTKQTCPLCRTLIHQMTTYSPHTFHSIQKHCSQIA